MCYSAMLVQSWHAYLRLTGAQMDLDQFVEVFGARAAGSSIRIPRGLDLALLRSDRPEHAPLRDAIRTYRRAAAAKLEAELFEQRRRLADAERALGSRTTKKALENRRIASSRITNALARLPLLAGEDPHENDWRIFPMTYAPLVTDVDGVRRVRLARYHCRQDDKSPAIDRELPGLYNARRDSLDRFWSRQFGRHHGLLFAESFFENVERNGANAVLHFTPRPQGPMRIACLAAEWTDPQGGPGLLSFAAITDEPPAEVAAAGHDRMIVIIRPDNVDAWLRPAGRPRSELQKILSDRESRHYDHEVRAA